MMSSPLGQHILHYEPPREFVIPPFAMYDGSTDPYDHMLHFNQAIILNAGDDRLLCKVFPTSLKAPTLAWFHNLPRGSINSFSELWVVFVSRYLCSVRQKGNINSLQAIVGPERHVQIYDPITKGLLSNPRQWRHKTCWNQIRLYTQVITQLPKRLLSNPW